MTKLEKLIQQIKNNPNSIKQLTYELDERLVNLFDKVGETIWYYEIIKKVDYIDIIVVDIESVIHFCTKYLSSMCELSKQLTTQLGYIKYDLSNYIHDEAEKLYNELGYIEPTEINNNHKLQL